MSILYWSTLYILFGGSGFLHIWLAAVEPNIYLVSSVGYLVGTIGASYNIFNLYPKIWAVIKYTHVRTLLLVVIEPLQVICRQIWLLLSITFNQLRLNKQWLVYSSSFDMSCPLWSCSYMFDLFVQALRSLFSLVIWFLHFSAQLLHAACNFPLEFCFY